jgi:hypothetical protein
LDRKHLHYSDPRITGLRGIEIDRSDRAESVSDSIRVNPEFDSKVINESD